MSSVEWCRRVGCRVVLVRWRHTLPPRVATAPALALRRTPHGFLKTHCQCCSVLAGERFSSIERPGFEPLPCPAPAVYLQYDFNFLSAVHLWIFSSDALKIEGKHCDETCKSEEIVTLKDVSSPQPLLLKCGGQRPQLSLTRDQCLELGRTIDCWLITRLNGKRE